MELRARGTERRASSVERRVWGCSSATEWRHIGRKQI